MPKFIFRKLKPQTVDFISKNRQASNMVGALQENFKFGDSMYVKIQSTTGEHLSCFKEGLLGYNK